MKAVSDRQVVYKFVSLNYVLQREIANKLVGIPLNVSFKDDAEFHLFFFRRVKLYDKIEALKQGLFPDYDPKPDTHPCA